MTTSDANLVDVVRPPSRALRFDLTTRTVHWLTALVLGVTLLTGLALYWGPLSAAIGRRELLRHLHVWSGIASPAPLLVAYAARSRSSLRGDVHRLARWTKDDVRWLRTFGRRAQDRVGKFNGGQKANAVFVVGAIAVQLMTGAIMRWYEPFPLAWRTGATFVHDWTAIALWLVIAGHILKALSEPASLRAMVNGWMDSRAARRSHPRWWDDEVSRDR